jgi:hypothetical protein
MIMSDTIYDLFLDYYNQYIFGTTGVIGELSVLVAITSTLLALVFLFRFLVFTFKFAFGGLFR